MGVINYEITPLNKDAKITFKPYVDAGVHNEDANWEERFWETLDTKNLGNQAFVTARTFKTGFVATTYMHNSIFVSNEEMEIIPNNVETSSDKILFSYEVSAISNQTVSIQKLGGYTVSTNHDDTVIAAEKIIEKGLEIGYETLVENQKNAWSKIWEMSDITIDGDVKAQQGIRFNIFQLNQTKKFIIKL